MNILKNNNIIFQTESSHPDKAGSMISFGDVEVARINLGAGLMASSRPWLCLSYESLKFIDFFVLEIGLFGKWYQPKKIAALLLQTLIKLNN